MPFQTVRDATRNEIDLTETRGFTLALDDYLADAHEDIHKVPE